MLFTKYLKELLNTIYNSGTTQMGHMEKSYTPSECYLRMKNNDLFRK